MWRHESPVGRGNATTIICLNNILFGNSAIWHSINKFMAGLIKTECFLIWKNHICPVHIQMLEGKFQFSRCMSIRKINFFLPGQWQSIPVDARCLLTVDPEQFNPLIADKTFEEFVTGLFVVKLIISSFCCWVVHFVRPAGRGRLVVLLWTWNRLIHFVTVFF